MNIGIDVRPLKRHRSGIGNYVYGLVEYLPKMAPEHDYFLYSNREMNVPPQSNGARLHKQVEQAFRWSPGSFWLLSRGGKLARRDKLDVLWMTSPVLPMGIPPHVLTIVTVYDLVWLRIPGAMTSYNRFVFRTLAERAIRRADMIVAISCSTRDDLVHFLRVPTEKIVVVYPGISARYTPRNAGAAAEYISRKYGVPPRYLAAVGTVEPRKNLGLLVGALSILKRQGRLECPLLVSGAMGWKNSELFNEVRRAGLTENEIRFLGFLPDEDLPFFYAGAQLFLFPSHYEGFGLPPLEAMACGTPVIASNAPCMPEVLGDAAILQSPADSQQFAKAVLKVMGDVNLRHMMREAGICRARSFSWSNSFKDLLQAIEKPDMLVGAERGACV